MNAPFNVDTAAQIAQTQGFKGLVEATMANNNQMKGIADSAMAANQGQMSQAFNVWLADISQAAVHNNQVLDSIADALQFGIQSTDTTEASNAADFQALTGQIASPFSGSQFT